MQPAYNFSYHIRRTQSKLLITVLRPIVGILLRAGIPFQTFSSSVRRLYVDVAREEFGIRGRKTNVSRVAMLTGLSRTMVRAALDEDNSEKSLSNADEDPGLDSLRHLSRILLGWYVDERFQDEHGQPAPLDIEGAEGRIGFNTLYNDYSGKLAPSSAMLKELLEVGAVESLPDGRIIARSRQYIPRKTDAYNLERICQVVGDLAASGSHNLHRNTGQGSRFERIATNQNVPESQEAAFHAFLEQEGQHFLERVDNWLSHVECVDENEPKKRIGVGVFEINSNPIKQDER
ncbi:MAG: DUF6502 family protein [Gammaproteobacteria bacterium]